MPLNLETLNYLGEDPDEWEDYLWCRWLPL
jgi:hypothetical protein